MRRTAFPLLGYALRRTDNTDDAADVLAETFLAAWRRLDEVPAGDEAKLWLYGTARRVLANHRRGERRRLALADRLKTDLAVTYRPADHDGGAADLAAAFRRIPRGRPGRARARGLGRARSRPDRLGHRLLAQRGQDQAAPRQAASRRRA